MTNSLKRSEAAFLAMCHYTKYDHKRTGEMSYECSLSIISEIMHSSIFQNITTAFFAL